MASLANSVRQLAAEIVIRDKTGEGAASAASSFDKVATSADGAARVVEKTEKFTQSADRAYARLQRRLDPLAAAQERFERDQRALTRAMDLGVISADRYQTNLRQLQSEFERTRSRIESTDRAQKQSNETFSRFGGVLSAAKGAVAGFFAAFSFRALISGAREAVSALDEIAKKARSLGGIGEAGFLQEARFALGQQGIDDADKLLEQFNRRRGQLAFGKGEGVELLRRIEGGEELKRQVLDAKSLEQAYEIVIDKIGKVEDASKRAALAGAFFGEELAGKLGAALEQGVDGLDRLQEDARAAGIVLGDSLLVRAEELNDRFEKAGATIRTQLRGALIEIGPILADLAEKSAEIVRTLSSGLSNFINRQTDISSQTEITRLQSIAATATEDIRRINASGAGLDVTHIEQRRESAESRIAQLIATQVISSEELLNTLNGTVTVAGALGDTIDTGAVKATEAAAKAAEKLQSAYEAAAQERFRQVEDLRVLAEAASRGPEELRQAQERLRIEAEIERLRADADKAGAVFNKAAEEARIAEADRLRAEIADDTERANAEKRFAEGYRRELYDVADDFVRRLARGDLSSFRDFARSLKDILFDAVLSPFRNAFANLVSGLFSPGGAFSIFTPGIAGPVGANGGAAPGFGFGGFNLSALAPAALGFGGLALGGASSVFGLASLIGPGALGRFGASVGNFFGLSGGATNSISGALAGAGTLTGALGGIGGSVLSGALFGKSTGQSIGSAIGGIAGNLIPIPVVGSLIGSFLGGAIGSLFGGKPSDFAAGGGVSFSTFSPENQFAKGTENVEARDQILQATASLARQLAELTDATLAGSGISIQVGSRNGTRIISAAGGDVTTPVGDVAAAEAEIVRQLTASLQGGDAALVELAKTFGAAKKPVDEIIERLGKLKAVLADPDDYVDPLKEKIDAIAEAFEGLDISTGALKKAFDDVTDRLARNVNEEARKAILAEDNPQLAAIEELLKQQDARRVEIDRLTAQGGNVDATLIAEFQRRQLLNQFNISDRFAQAVDPVAFGIDELIKSQENERAAFRRAIEGSGGLLTEADFLGLLRAQEAERFNVFQGLSDEDKARLSGRAGDFTDLSRQYALTVERLIEETKRLIDSFEEERQRLQQTISKRGEEAISLDEAVRSLDVRRGLRTPGQGLDILRAQLEDLGNRAFSDDEQVKSAARAALPAAAQAYADELERVFASSPAADSGIRFARDLLASVRDRAAEEKSIAERQLEQLEATRDAIEEIRDLMAAPRLDIAALVNATAGLDQNAPIALLALQLADLEARQTAQTDRLVAALEALTPADVGLGFTADTTSAISSASPAQIFSTAGVIAPASNSTAQGGDSDIAQGLFAVAAAIDSQTATIVSIETEKKSGRQRQEDYLKQISTRRLATV